MLLSEHTRGETLQPVDNLGNPKSRRSFEGMREPGLASLRAAEASTPFPRPSASAVPRHGHRRVPRALFGDISGTPRTGIFGRKRHLRSQHNCQLGKCMLGIYLTQKEGGTLWAANFPLSPEGRS
jgi:hypothetical protein